MKTKQKTMSKSRKSDAKGNTTKATKKKFIIASLAAGTASIVGYFGWQYWKHKKQGSTNNDIDAVLKQNNSIPEQPAISPSYVAEKPKAKPISTYKYTPKTKNDDFPLKKGSKGDNVRLLQEALISKGAKINVDGDFGTKTENALKKANLPTSIDQSTFNFLTKINSSAVGNELSSVVKAKNFNKALDALKKLKSTEDYSSANTVFKTHPIKTPNTNRAVSQTIVNGMLNTFSSADQKEKIGIELARMGLQYDGDKWSLSGIEGVSLITIEPATVWANAKESVKVPARMVLGNEVSRRLDYTLFENKGKYFLVNTKSVQHL